MALNQMCAIVLFILKYDIEAFEMFPSWLVGACCVIDIRVASIYYHYYYY